jgi:general secretion pathway protein G
MKPLHVLADDGGWTFVETVITVGIVLVLSSTTGITAYRYLEDAREAAVRGELTTIGIALDSYALDCGTYPTTEQGLQALWEAPYFHPVPKEWDGPYLGSPVSADPWGNPYVYRREEHRGAPYTLYSLGAPEATEPIYLHGTER